MAAFFDAGHIVTNNPIARIDKMPSQGFLGQFEIDFNDAVNGGADYFVLGFLEYQQQGRRGVPIGMILKLYTTDSQTLIFEQHFPAGSGRNNNEEYQLALNAGRAMTSHLQGR
jgi:hypothetical protein